MNLSFNDALGRASKLGSSKAHLHILTLTQHHSIIANPTRMSQRLPNTLRSVRSGKIPWLCAQCRSYATPPASSLPAPPLLLKIRKDLKTAMQEKDKNRLNVLRGLLAEVTNSAKTSNPVKTDMQLLAMLRKRAAACKAASSEFKTAGRQDLVEQEEQQAAIMSEYAGSVETTSAEDIQAAVMAALEQLKTGTADGKIKVAQVMKILLAPGGALDGKPVEKAQVFKLADDAVSGRLNKSASTKEGGEKLAQGAKDVEYKADHDADNLVGGSHVGPGTEEGKVK